MLTTARRLGAVTATAVLGSVLALPLVPAHAEAVTSPAYVTAVDTDGDGNYGLISRPTPTGTATEIVPQTDSQNVDEVSTSKDGSRIISVESTYSDTSTHSKVVVRDASGRLVRVLEDVLQSETAYSFDFGAELSPDGSTAVWTNVAFGSGAGAPVTTIRRANVLSGAPVSISGSTGLALSAFLDSSTLIAFHFDSGDAVTLPLAGGATSPVTGLPAYSAEITVSPDGTRLAFTTDKDPNGNLSVSVSDVSVAPFTLTSGVATVGTVTPLTSTLSNSSPAWVDNATVDFVRYDGDVSDGAVWTAAADGLTPATSTGTTGDVIDLAVAFKDAVAPGAVTTLPATLAGSTAVLRWQPPSDTDQAGVLLSRYVGTAATGTPQRTGLYVAGPATAFLDTGLLLGETYTYTFTAVDRSGNLGTAATRSLTAASAGAVTTDPTSATATKAPFLVRFSPYSPSTVTYTVDYRVNSSPTFTRWITETAGSARAFGSAAATGVAATTSVPGSTYRFKVRGTDSFGNATGTALSAPAVVPFDQSKATLYGGRNATQAPDFLGSVRIMAASSNYAKLTATGGRFQVIGQRCASCGVVDVYDGATRVATIDTRAASTQYRVVLFTRTYASIGTHTLTLKPRATAGRPNLVLDGFAVRQ